MKRGAELAAWLAVALCAAPWPGLVGPRREHGTSGPLARWLGPVAGLAASAEWVRWNTALRQGRPEQAYAFAARALALDPGSPEGWATLGQHLLLDRSSATMEPVRARRAAWAAAGFEVLREGEGRARDPGALAVIAGDLAVFLAELAGGDLDWPGGAEALLERADAAFARAQGHGHPQAAERRAALAAARAGGRAESDGE